MALPEAAHANVGTAGDTHSHFDVRRYEIVGNTGLTTEEISLRTNTLINSHLFQRELDSANANRDRQVYPTIGPGAKPGTTALTLKVTDRLPLHFRFDLDNYSTPGTPDLRLNFAAQYNNLWQHENQLGVSYGFSPQEMKSVPDYADYFFTRPLIAYYGAFYRAAVGEAVRAGWAEAGVCVRLSADEVGLNFLPVQTEALDFCFTASLTHDPRVQALIGLLRSRAHRRFVSELPRYDARETGELLSV